MPGARSYLQKQAGLTDRHRWIVQEARDVLATNCPRLVESCYWAGTCVISLEVFQHRESHDLAFRTRRAPVDIRPLFSAWPNAGKPLLAWLKERGAPLKRTYRFAESSGLVTLKLPDGKELSLPVVVGILKHPDREGLPQLLGQPEVAEKYTLEALRKATCTCASPRVRTRRSLSTGSSTLTSGSRRTCALAPSRSLFGRGAYPHNERFQRQLGDPDFKVAALTRSGGRINF